MAHASAPAIPRGFSLQSAALHLRPNCFANLKGSPMQIPLQINSEHADLSQAARAAIEHEVERLEKCEHHITGCRVAVVAPSAKHRHGTAYRINIWVTIPPHENIVVSHQPSDDRGPRGHAGFDQGRVRGGATPNRGSGKTLNRASCGGVSRADGFYLQAGWKRAPNACLC
jgi:hypothetical protein